MSELLMVDAALFQLRAAMSGAADDPAAAPMRLAMEVLEQSIAAAHEGLNAARVNDVAFALTDLAALAEGLSATAAAEVVPPIQMLQDDVARLRETTAMPPDLLAAIRAFQTKLRERRATIERNTFRSEDTPETPLPHPLPELAAEGQKLRDRIAAAGFATPSLDGFLAEPATLRFYALGEMIDELDVIAG